MNAETKKRVRPREKKGANEQKSGASTVALVPAGFLFLGLLTKIYKDSNFWSSLIAGCWMLRLPFLGSREKVEASREKVKDGATGTAAQGERAHCSARTDSRIRVSRS